MVAPLYLSIWIPHIDVACNKRIMVVKIISGGQTGADEAALAAAKSLGLATGGTVPAGWLSDHHHRRPSLKQYDLHELPSMPIRQALVRRSCINVDDADGTLVFRLRPSPGTDGTINYCRTGRWKPSASSSRPSGASHAHIPRPLFIVTELTDTQVINVNLWLRATGLKVLNVAGHRETEGHSFTDQVRDFLVRVLSDPPMPNTIQSQ